MKTYLSTDPFIVKCFEANTCHITLTDNQCLRRDIKTEHNPTLIVYPYEYGYFIFTDFEPEILEETLLSLEKEGYSKHFINLVKLARQHGCKFLQLDGDGVEYSDLPHLW